MNIDSQSVGQEIASSVTSVNKGVAQRETVTEASNKLDVLSKELSSLAETKKPEEIKASPEQIDSAISEISEFVQAANRQLNFSIDENSNKQIVKVTDATSGEVIRQIPSEEILELSERLKDLHAEVGSAVGVLFNKQV